jgi:predicted enzyme related to lactoylglutathione lyase
MGQPVMQWQILAKNPDQLSNFYGQLFGWTAKSDNALGYRTIDTGAGRGINGGMWPAPPEGRAMVTLYIEVDDVPEYVKKATGLGASIIMPHQKLPDGDEMAVILDPEGIPIGLFRPSTL